MTPAGTNLLLAHADAAPAPSEPVTKSLRCDSASSAYLTRTPSSTSATRTKWVFSTWAKRSRLGYAMPLYQATAVDGSDIATIHFGADDRLEIAQHSSGYVSRYLTEGVFRDPAAWYHITVVFDTTIAEANRVKLYVNGVLETAWNIETPVGPSATWSYGTQVGHMINNMNHYTTIGGGYFADVYWLDGTVTLPSGFTKWCDVFAEEDGTTGQWKPKATSGLTFGTNGFHLDFEDSSDIGNDVSGAGNDWTPTNLAASDVVNDRPTDNYPVFNPLFITHSGAGNDTLSEGNTKVVTHGTGIPMVPSTIYMPPNSGTYYAEFTMSAAGAMFGIIRDDAPEGARAYHSSYGWGYEGHPSDSSLQYKVTGAVAETLTGSQASYPSKGGVSYNTDTGEVKFYIGGTDRGGYTGLSTDHSYGFWAGDGSGAISYTLTANFDENDWDNTPSGVKQLSTAQLPTPTIAKGEDYFTSKLWTGTATSPIPAAKVLDFPWSLASDGGLVWQKMRNSVGSHYLFDTVRGDDKALYSDLTDVEQGNYPSYYTQDFDGSGDYSIQQDFDGSGNGDEVNRAGKTYVAWGWKKSATAGFNIVGWTGDAEDYDTGTQEVNHGLGVAPEMIIAKGRTDNAGMDFGWFVYHKDTSTDTYLVLNSSDMEAGDEWTTMPLTNIGAVKVDVGTDDSNIYLNYGGDEYSDADTYIGYFFASVDGYSKVGSFSGSSTAFIYTGFRPSFILAKRSDDSGNWLMFDDEREGYNVDNDVLMANDRAIEATADYIDILSNGFKIRTSDSDLNSGTVIYYAVAKSPLKYASAR